MKNSSLIFGLMASFGKAEYTIYQLLQLTKPFNITESSLRTNLSRMSTKGILTSRKDGKTVFYRFYKKADRIKKIAGLGFRPPSWENWDNTWWGVAFSVPNINNDKRYKIRKKLIAYRFVPLYPGFWIRPLNPIESEVFNFEDKLIKDHCKVINYKDYYDIDKKDVQKLWQLDGVNNKFKKGLDKMKLIFNDLNFLSPEKTLVKRMEIGDYIVNLMVNDPLLPDIYLPDTWLGNELRTTFYNLDKKLSEISKPFWSKILT